MLEKKKKPTFEHAFNCIFTRKCMKFSDTLIQLLGTKIVTSPFFRQKYRKISVLERSEKKYTSENLLENF